MGSVNQHTSRTAYRWGDIGLIESVDLRPAWLMYSLVYRFPVGFLFRDFTCMTVCEVISYDVWL